jgi:hypothetical protein
MVKILLGDCDDGLPVDVDEEDTEASLELDEFDDDHDLQCLITNTAGSTLENIDVAEDIQPVSCHQSLRFRIPSVYQVSDSRQ